MTDYELSSAHVGEEDELTPVGDDDEELYRIRRSRAEGFDDEVVFVRLLLSDETYDWEELRKTDIQHLEREFYDDDTPNRLNIQLFWAYEEGAEPDEDTRRKLERRTKFAIRRCIPRDTLGSYLRPLERSQDQLDDVNEEFGREALVQQVIENGLKFLLDQSTSRDDKLEELERVVTDDETDSDSGSDSDDGPSVSTTDDRPSHIERVELGDFRPEASERALDLEPFTVLYGRNGAGKTSLLDGITMGLVGQTRRDEDRADAYDGLSVTLEGDDGPLSKDPSSVNDRVADWYGFRPEGPAKRYVEYYRVNYHEAGETTRLLEESTELEVKRVFENFLYGENLAYAKKEKRKLVDQIETKIDETEAEISECNNDINRLQERKRSVEETLSTLESARRDLSPAATALVAGDAEWSEKPEGEDDDTTTGRATPRERIKQWRDSRRRLERIETAVEEAEFEWKSGSACDLTSRLAEEKQGVSETKSRLERIRTLEDEQRRVKDVRKHVESSGIGGIPFSTFFFGLLLVTAGQVDRGDARRLVAGIEETDLELGAAESTQSVESWFETVETELRTRQDELEETRNKLRELNDLAERRRELREQIRADTEEYLEITDDEKIDHCPACYVEQSAEEIRTREEPEHTHDADGVPQDLTASLETVDAALRVVESADPVAVDDDISRYEEGLCDPSDVGRPFEAVADGHEAVVFDDATTSVVNTVARLAESQRARERSVEEVLSAMLTETEDEIADLASDVADYDPETDLQQQIDDREEQLSAIQSGLDVLEEQWPEELLDERLRVASDRRAITDAIANAEITEVEPPGKLSDSIIETALQARELSTDIETYEQARSLLNRVFEDIEDSLNEVLSEYTAVVTTLFQVFQRPYEFERVMLNDNNELRVVRRGSDEGVDLSKMSAGQRTALALAIFVTNNLAHDTAPPVMLLDEPFAHLDELNTLSFFNLVIELAVRGERQIVFATANDNLASLLEQKVGETDAFDRVDLDVR